MHEDQPTSVEDRVWKAREARARRQAGAQGLHVTKSRRRNESALDFGSYWLVNTSGNWLVLGGDYGVGLNDVEAYLQDERLPSTLATAPDTCLVRGSLRV